MEQPLHDVVWSPLKVCWKEKYISKSKEEATQRNDAECAKNGGRESFRFCICSPRSGTWGERPHGKSCEAVPRRSLSRPFRLAARKFDRCRSIKDACTSFMDDEGSSRRLISIRKGPRPSITLANRAFSVFTQHVESSPNFRPPIFTIKPLIDFILCKYQYNHVRRLSLMLLDSSQPLMGHSCRFSCDHITCTRHVNPRRISIESNKNLQKQRGGTEKSGKTRWLTILKRETRTLPVRTPKSPKQHPRTTGTRISARSAERSAQRKKKFSIFLSYSIMLGAILTASKSQRAMVHTALRWTCTTIRTAGIHFSWGLISFVEERRLAEMNSTRIYRRERGEKYSSWAQIWNFFYGFQFP